MADDRISPPPRLLFYGISVRFVERESREIHPVVQHFELPPSVQPLARQFAARQPLCRKRLHYGQKNPVQRRMIGRRIMRMGYSDADSRQFGGQHLQGHHSAAAVHVDRIESPAIQQPTQLEEIFQRPRVPVGQTYHFAPRLSEHGDHIFVVKYGRHDSHRHTAVDRYLGQVIKHIVGNAPRGHSSRIDDNNPIGRAPAHFRISHSTCHIKFTATNSTNCRIHIFRLPTLEPRRKESRRTLLCATRRPCPE